VSEIFLGAIAISTVVMAIVQVGVIIFAARLARRVDQLSDQIQHDIVPVMASLKTVGENLERMSGVATLQVERIDRLVSEASQRIQDTLGLVQGAIVGPLREGMAVVAAVRGILAAFRSLRGGDGRRSSRFDDEDPLFIG
jgi:predicted PurR-regulated permease PerM